LSELGSWFGLVSYCCTVYFCGIEEGHPVIDTRIERVLCLPQSPIWQFKSNKLITDYTFGTKYITLATGMLGTMLAVKIEAIIWFCLD